MLFIWMGFCRLVESHRHCKTHARSLTSAWNSAKIGGISFNTVKFYTIVIILSTKEMLVLEFRVPLSPKSVYNLPFEFGYGPEGFLCGLE